MVHRKLQEPRRREDLIKRATMPLRVGFPGLGVGMLVGKPGVALGQGFILQSKYRILVDLAIWFIDSATLLLILPVVLTGLYGILLRVTAHGNERKLDKGKRIIEWTVFIAFLMLIADDIVWAIASLSESFFVI